MNLFNYSNIFNYYNWLETNSVKKDDHRMTNIRGVRAQSIPLRHISMSCPTNDGANATVYDKLCIHNVNKTYKLT